MTKLYDRSYGYSLISDGVLLKGKKYDIKYSQYSKKCEITGEDGARHTYPSECFRFENYVKSRSKKWKQITRGEDGIRRDGYGNILKDKMICPWCGTTFNQKNKNQKYCCYECSLKYQRAHYKRDDSNENVDGHKSLNEYAKRCVESKMSYGQIVTMELLNAMKENNDGTSN